jgi:hypothetical protein
MERHLRRQTARTHGSRNKEEDAACETATRLLGYYVAGGGYTITAPN